MVGAAFATANPALAPGGRKLLFATPESGERFQRELWGYLTADELIFNEAARVIGSLRLYFNPGRCKSIQPDELKHT